MSDILAWHFLKDDHRTGRGNLLVEPGQVLRVEGDLELCKNGLRASRRALDALQYAPGPVVQRVILRGTILEDDDKIVGRERECLWIADATPALHRFMLWHAEETLKLVAEPDPRSLNALEVKRRWLDGQATDSELDAAWEVVWTAARTVAKNVAWDAAWTATRNAAWDAVWNAAWDVAWNAQNEKLETLLLALKPQEDAR